MSWGQKTLPRFLAPPLNWLWAPCQSLPLPCPGLPLCRMGLCCTKSVVKSKEAACCESAMQTQVMLITAARAQDTQMPTSPSPCHCQLGHEEGTLLNLLSAAGMRRTALPHSRLRPESDLTDEMGVWTGARQHWRSQPEKELCGREIDWGFPGPAASDGPSLPSSLCRIQPKGFLRESGGCGAQNYTWQVRLSVPALGRTGNRTFL